MQALGTLSTGTLPCRRACAASWPGTSGHVCFAAPSASARALSSRSIAPSAPLGASRGSAVRASRVAYVTEAKSGRKVALLGAAGGIGQPLALLLKMQPYVSELALYDIANTVGVAADLSHCNTNVKVPLEAKLVQCCAHKLLVAHMFQADCFPGRSKRACWCGKTQPGSRRCTSFSRHGRSV